PHRNARNGNLFANYSSSARGGFLAFANSFPAQIHCRGRLRTRLAVWQGVFARCTETVCELLPVSSVVHLWSFFIIVALSTVLSLERGFAVPAASVSAAS